ncbi:MAG: class I SAM-dependent methyltransferase [Candidatus Sericytochromatia bacterium]
MKNLIKNLQEKNINFNDLSSKQFTTALFEIIKKIPENSTVLDIGCGSGVGKLIANKVNKNINEYWGLDFNNSSKKYAEKILDKYLYLDIENFEDNLLPNNYFDVIILADVLEHLVSPELIISKIKKYLKTDGFIMLSIPNVLHQTVILNLLLNGSWYNGGVVVEEHLKFFTFNEINKFFEKSNLFLDKDIICISTEIDPKMIALLKTIKPWIKEEYEKRIIEVTTYQYVLKLTQKQSEEVFNIIQVPNILYSLDD